MATKQKMVKRNEERVSGLAAFAAFKVHNFLASKRNALVLDRIVVDNRFFSQYGQEILRDQVNCEIIAEKIVADDLHTKVVNMLTDRSAEKVLNILYPVPLVNLDVPFIRNSRLLEACYTVTNDMELTLILAEYMKHCLAPYGVLHPVEESSVIVSPHMDMLPTENDILVDILKREIEGALKTIGTPYRGSERKMGTSVMGSIISNVLSDVGKAMLFIGEYGSIVKDVFRLIRASIDFTTDYKGIPNDLVRHPHVSAMARNVTLARIACGPAYNDTSIVLNTATYELKERITQIYNFITSSQRYTDISLSDFASRFSKSVVLDSKGKKRAMTVSMNLIGAPCAQVVHVTKDSISMIDCAKIFELPDASAQLTSSYGELLKRCSTYESAALLDSVMSNYVQLIDIGQPVYTCVGFIDEIDIKTREVIGHALALAKCDPARPAFVSIADEGGLQFAYEVDLEGKDYEPVSGTRMANGALLTDPFEYLLLVDDWRGDKALTDRMQLLPKTALDDRHVVLDHTRIGALPFNRRQRISIAINEDTYEALLVPNVVFGVRDTEAQVITPILNRAVIATHLFAVLDALTIADSIESAAQRVAVKAVVFEHVFMSVVEGLDPNMVQRIGKEIRTQIIASSPQSSYHMEGKLSLRMYKKLIELHAADFILRRYGIYEDASSDTGTGLTSELRAILEDRDFGTFLGVVVKSEK